MQHEMSLGMRVWDPNVEFTLLTKAELCTTDTALCAASFGEARKAGAAERDEQHAERAHVSRIGHPTSASLPGEHHKLLQYAPTTLQLACLLPCSKVIKSVSSSRPILDTPVKARDLPSKPSALFQNDQNKLSSPEDSFSTLETKLIIHKARKGQGKFIRHGESVLESVLCCSKRQELHEDVAGPCVRLFLLSDQHQGCQSLLPGCQELRQQRHPVRLLPRRSRDHRGGFLL
jgi:hypothetical protein